jgi:hypothetical protein
MTKSPPTRPPSSSPSPPRPRLLTHLQVICALREERGMHGLTATAEKYGIAVSQLCDLLSFPPRTKLSKRLRESLRLRLYEFYEKLED